MKAMYYRFFSKKNNKISPAALLRGEGPVTIGFLAKKLLAARQVFLLEDENLKKYQLTFGLKLYLPS